jgi:S-adenosylmethionine uptake transporter
MSAPVLMVLASLLFAGMGVCVKLASAQFNTGEIVFWRGVIGMLFVLSLVRLRGGTLRTTVPLMHLTRAGVGVTALMLWFWSMSQLPLATAVTLNYMSSVWMALFLIGGAVLMGASRVDLRLVATVMAGFAGVALVLQPSLAPGQAAGALAGLLSGMVSALAYLQVTALGRSGEPEYRIVFYFSMGGALAGLGMAWVLGAPFRGYTPGGAGLLLAIGLLATSAQMAMTRAYAIGRTLSNASLQYLGIVFSCIFGVTLFDDPLTPPALAGMLLIIGAGVVATRLRQQAAADAPDSTADA